MEVLGLRSRSFPWVPAPCSGPLCRSAASGHSVRARALLAPPPFLGVRTPLPSRFGPAFCRETLRWRLRAASSVGLAAWVPREGAGPLGSRLGCHAAGGGGLGSGLRPRLTVVCGGIVPRTWGPSPRVFPPKFTLSAVGTERTAARGHTLSRSFCPFLRGKRRVSCAEEGS